MSFSEFLYLLGTITFGVALVIAFYSTRLLKYRIDPELRKLVEDYSVKSSEELSKKLLSHYINSYEENLETITGQKAHWIKYSFYTTLFGIGLLSASVIIEVLK